MIIFNELRRHGRLAARRHPMYEENLAGKIISYVMAAGWAGYLIFFGTILASSFTNMVPNWEPYHVMNGIALIFILALDFLLRIPFQKTPTQEVKPYLLLPVKKKRIIDFLLLRSGLSLFNLFWLFLFVPFSFLTITKFFGVLGVISYLIGIWLIILINNYWYLLCRTLINERIWWILLPVAFYGGITFLLIIPDSPVSSFLIDLGDGYMEGNILYFLGTILIIAILWWINRRVISGLIYAELAKTNDSKIKHVSDYKFFERYGEVGEYMRLELKMLLRNRSCKGLLRNTFVLIIMFSCVLSFSNLYDGGFMPTFIAIYNFSVFGMIILIRTMSFEGNYLDGMMSRKGSILSLLRAKYYVYSIGEIIPFTLMIPAIIMNKLTLLGAFSWFFYTIGFIYFCNLQLVVYNKQTIPLNEKVTTRQSNGGIQIIISLCAFGVPLLLYSALNALFGETIAHITLLIIGLGFILSSPYWIRNIYQRFMKHRYENMEGFRNSRQ
ncbi:DUF5687 family protein [Bacteroides faecalis]|nr:DUF5687 family protein [Bacteroides faecalis]